MIDRVEVACPVCGEAILAAAKRCKHCREWLPAALVQPSDLVDCPACAEEISLHTSICPFCKEPIVGLPISSLSRSSLDVADHNEEEVSPEE